MVKFSKAFSIILFIAAISFASSSFGAEVLSKDRCQSSVLIDGMKVELSLTAPIIVDKNTNKLVENDFNDERQERLPPGIRLSFTAIDKDIQWQEYLYSFGIDIWYMNGNDPKGLLIQSTRPNVSESLIKVDVLKKGMNMSKVHSISFINFAEIFEKNGFNITFGALGRLHDIKKMAPNPTITNIYEGDKNIWQAPFEICLKAKWQYN
ncbi:hypothetical protein [Bartonella sp. HY761]|uniref:hypothetical protein n=1 Tax=Bartonella sp. HY761 TaxID=2979330 RepID=UPI0021E2B8EF|nr:hypothetical protein [Bartonella sp. HY761]UXN07971.1 hypothetical protein N6A79_15300 [Bartonella sp. HY761]